MASELSMRDILNRDELELIIKAALDIGTPLTDDDWDRLETAIVKLRCAGIKPSKADGRTNGM